MQIVKKRAVKLKAVTVKKRIQLNKEDVKKSPKISEGGYMWVG